MKLVFFSGGHLHENNKLYSHTVRLSGHNDPLMTFIPNSSVDGEIEFEEFVASFHPLGVRRFLYFPLDVPFDPVMEETVLKSDVIHMGGGNTFYFLKHLRGSRFLQKLKLFAKNGGVLSGLSAGAIVMTPTIETASFPSFDCDVNEENLRNFKSMGLAPFHFFPHYRASKRYDRELSGFSRKIDAPLFACPDGAGIISDNGDLTFTGRCVGFIAGKKVLINPFRTPVQSVNKVAEFNLSSVISSNSEHIII